MTDINYLMKFRKCTSNDSLERLYDKLNDDITDSQSLMNMYRAADHRRAELVARQFFDLGKIPKSLWAQVK